MVARQQQALGVPGIGVEGDFADLNPRFTVLAGPGGLVSGSAGVFVGRFGWLSTQSIDPDNAATIVNNFGVGVPDGFVPRSGQESIITTYLATSTLLIQPGAQMWMAAGGGFLMRNSGTGFVLPGMKAYANFANGLVTFAASGTPTTASGSSSSIAAGTWSATGSISGNVLTVGSITGAQGLPLGATVTGTGVTAGTVVTAQLTGPLGGAGTYSVNIGEQSVVAGTSLSGTFGVLTVGGTVVTPIGVGAIVAGSGVTAGTVVTAGLAQNANLTGAGGAGTYAVNLTQTASATAMTFTTNVETKWYARSGGGANELIKASEVSQ